MDGGMWWTSHHKIINPRWKTTILASIQTVKHIESRLPANTSSRIAWPQAKGAISKLLQDLRSLQYRLSDPQTVITTQRADHPRLCQVGKLDITDIISSPISHL